MDLKSLNKQRLINRTLLSNLYETLAFFKDQKRAADEDNVTHWEYVCHNRLKEVRKHIVELVALQKAIKQDISDQINKGRMLKGYLKLCAATGNAAKLTAMDAVGECYE